MNHSYLIVDGIFVVTRVCEHNLARGRERPTSGGFEISRYTRAYELVKSTR